MHRNFALLAFVAITILIPGSSSAEVLAAGTNVEARLTAPTGSRISHTGDPVEATVIAPVMLDGKVAIPQGATVSGIVQNVARLGLGLKHTTAGIEYRFKSLRMPDGTTLSIDAGVVNVETAKERVNAQGMIGGIHPTANFTLSVAFCGLKLLYANPYSGIPVLGVKFLVARSPDPEIYFPAGTEMILQLAAAMEIPIDDIPHDRIPSLSAAEMDDARGVLSKLPRQRTDSAPNQPSDLINILILGDRDSIKRAFEAAGWLGAQRNSLVSVYRVYHCVTQRIGYSMAPMRKMTLNGNSAGAEYQKSLDTFSKRHHLRLWKQGDEDVWLGAATEDVGYEVRRMHLTHASDPLIDNERTKIVNDLAFTGCVDAAGLINRDGPGLSGPDQFVRTDGKVAILRMNDCRPPLTTAFEVAKSRSNPESRSVQVLLAVRNEIIRSNPISLASNAIRLLHSGQANSETAPASAFSTTRRRTALSKRDTQPRWIRPSVLDETNVALDARR